MHLLDIVQNSVEARATLIIVKLIIAPSKKRFYMVVRDNGCGIEHSRLENLTDPFYTSRNTRNVGMGLSLLNASVKRSFGKLRLYSAKSRGTIVTASFSFKSIDLPPLGDIRATILSLITLNPHIDFKIILKSKTCSYTLDTRYIKEILQNVEINNPIVIDFLRQKLETDLKNFEEEYKMMTLEELERIREEALERVQLRKEKTGTRIVVGMATCGISAGARPVLEAIMDEVSKRGLTDVIVAQTGCIGLCKYEPIVEVTRPGENKVTYIKMDPEKARKMIAEHIVNGHAIKEWTIESIQL